MIGVNNSAIHALPIGWNYRIAFTHPSELSVDVFVIISKIVRVIGLAHCEPNCEEAGRGQ
jgi:hypothetical protein